MILLVVYDIGSDARRSRVSSILEGKGARVQLSTFEIEIRDEDALNVLLGELVAVTDEDEDQIRLYQLEEKLNRDDQGPIIVGARVLEERRPFWIV